MYCHQLSVLVLMRATKQAVLQTTRASLTRSSSVVPASGALQARELATTTPEHDSRSGSSAVLPRVQAQHFNRAHPRRLFTTVGMLET